MPARTSSDGDQDLVRELKEDAQAALERRDYARAAELLLDVACREPDVPEWAHRAGEALRRAGDLPRAAQHLAAAAEGYARAGALLKAIALCRLVLQIEPGHRRAEWLLGEAEERRRSSTRTASGRIAVVSARDAAATSSGRFRVVDGLASIDVAPATRPADGAARRRGDSSGSFEITVDESALAIDRLADAHRGPPRFSEELDLSDLTSPEWTPHPKD